MCATTGLHKVHDNKRNKAGQGKTKTNKQKPLLWGSESYEEEEDQQFPELEKMGNIKEPVSSIFNRYDTGIIQRDWGNIYKFKPDGFLVLRGESRHRIPPLTEKHFATASC